MRLPIRIISLLLSCSALLGCWRTTLPVTVPPAANLMESVQSTTTHTTTQAVTIALLLPITGPLHEAGQAVRAGFIAAYQADNDAQVTHILTFDTGEQTVQQAYNGATQAQADLIIGPLEKNKLQTLVQAKLISKPTLSLNYLDDNSVLPAHFWQFGLSPLDEARQVTALAYQAGLRTAVIVAPRTHWGQALAQAYQAAWQEAGGTVAAHVYFNADGSQLGPQVRALVSQEAPKFNVMLLAATPQIARQIKPLLKFYANEELPVYATALVYSGTPQPAFDNDLNGVTFCDMPWTLSDSVNAAHVQPLRQQLALFWPTSFAHNSRLFALGIDAYQLSKWLPNAETATTPLAGATGQLTLAPGQLIVRQLSCAQFVRGLPHLIAQSNAVLIMAAKPTVVDAVDNRAEQPELISNDDTTDVADS